MSLTAPRIALAVLALVGAFGVAYAAGSAASGDSGSSDASSGVTPFKPSDSAPKVDGLSDSGSVPAMVPAPAPEASEPTTATPAEPAPATPEPAPAPAPAPAPGGGSGAARSSRASRAALLASGTIVSGYRIDGILGEGGMGIVYRATQLSLNRTVALKVLAAELFGDETFRERFRREGLLQAAIDHPHIVTVYEAGDTDDGLFLAMRLVRGSTLKEEVQAGTLTPDRTVRILMAVGDALDAAHEVGLIHRDVKPQNILVGKRDHAYLADFGLTKVPDESVPLTGTGQFVGTIDYISPEQAAG